MKKRYSEAVAGAELDVAFEDEEIALKVPNEGVTTSDEWTITPLSHPRVSFCSLYLATTIAILCSIPCRLLN